MKTIQTYVMSQHIPVIFPETKHIYLSDIVHGLTFQNRYNGHSSVPYTIAEHSILVNDILESKFPDSELPLYGLLHDAAEAYLGDIISPVKSCIGHEFIVLENKWMSVIADKFGLNNYNFRDSRIKKADEQAYIIESEFLDRKCDIEVKETLKNKQAFLESMLLINSKPNTIRQTFYDRFRKGEKRMNICETKEKEGPIPGHVYKSTWGEYYIASTRNDLISLKYGSIWSTGNGFGNCSSFVDVTDSVCFKVDNNGWS